MKPHTEQVLGIARVLVPGGVAWRGVRRAPLQPYLDAIAQFGSYRPRPQAETDPSWKQIIPYLVLRDGNRILLMRRTRAGGDARLHERYTIGIGGHVNPGDTDPLDALRREWREEIDADFEPTLEPLGVLNDDDNAVGTVHLGLVYSADAGGRSVGIRENDKLEGAFATFDEVTAIVTRLETWSAHLFEFLKTDG